MSLQEFFGPNFEAVKFVGQGSYGVIASVTCKNTGDSRAIKLVSSDNRNALREIEHLIELNHNCVVKYFRAGIGSIDNLDDEWMDVLEQKYADQIPRLMIAIELELCNGKYD